jgi:hypothetical protein
MDTTNNNPKPTSSNAIESDLLAKDRQLDQDRVYRLAKRKGFRLEKCRTRDKHHEDYGTYRLLNRNTNMLVLSARIDGYGLTLGEIAEYLDRHSKTNDEKGQ